ncbi:hypothetical protein XENTR_v10013086 [Xenopus tropicalis]|nr:hypothetical protein XENTR_v10013086 [Xenopus tropicalis]
MIQALSVRGRGSARDPHRGNYIPTWAPLIPMAWVSATRPVGPVTESQELWVIVVTSLRERTPRRVFALNKKHNSSTEWGNSMVG